MTLQLASGSVDKERSATESESSTRSVRTGINLSALRHNLTVARRLSRSRLFATVKADAYGHGAVAVARALSKKYDDPEWPACEESACADGFAVVTVDEALELREAGIEAPILVLQGPQNQEACAVLLHYRLWPVIHDVHQYRWFSRCEQRYELSAWLKVDTGMGRLGFDRQQASEILASNDGVRWRGLMTHFACADEPDNPFTQYQIDQFNTVDIPEHLAPEIKRSLANSAAVLSWPAARADWARPGIMLYGCNPLDRPLPEGVELKPVMSVSAPLISVKHMRSGAGIGYAQTYHCPQDMPVGYVALGYRDGLPRVLDTSATVSVGGQRCPIIGRVSMDSIAVDLRGVPEAEPGNSVEFWGAQASIDDLARAAGTINYELLTAIRGSRQYYFE